jgi:hypothetical protein
LNMRRSSCRLAHAVKRNKNDAADAEAICTAVTRQRFCSCQGHRPAIGADAASGAQPADPSTDHAGQCAPRRSGLIARQGLAHVERQCAAIDDEQSAVPELAAVDSPARRGVVERYAGQNRATRGEIGQMAGVRP